MRSLWRERSPSCVCTIADLTKVLIRCDVPNFARKWPRGRHFCSQKAFHLRQQLLLITVKGCTFRDNSGKVFTYATSGLSCPEHASCKCTSVYYTLCYSCILQLPRGIHAPEVGPRPLEVVFHRPTSSLSLLAPVCTNSAAP